MKRQIIFTATALFFSIQSYAQIQVCQNDNLGIKRMSSSIPQAAQEGKKNMPSTTISTRIFTYDAAGNRILMSTPARNAPASQYADLSQDEQVSLSMTTGLLRVSLPGEYHEPYSISVYNIAGQLVAERKNCRGMSQDINLSHLERGVYIIDIFEGKNHNKRKITKE